MLLQGHQAATARGQQSPDEQRPLKHARSAMSSPAASGVNYATLFKPNLYNSAQPAAEPQESLRRTELARPASDAASPLQQRHSRIMHAHGGEGSTAHLVQMQQQHLGQRSVSPVVPAQCPERAHQEGKGHAGSAQQQQQPSMEGEDTAGKNGKHHGRAMSSELDSLPSIADLPQLSGPGPMPQVRQPAKPYLCNRCDAVPITSTSS
jgi:hypothetical protein